MRKKKQKSDFWIHGISIASAIAIFFILNLIKNDLASALPKTLSDYQTPSLLGIFFGMLFEGFLYSYTGVRETRSNADKLRAEFEAGFDDISSKLDRLETSEALSISHSNKLLRIISNQLNRFHFSAQEKDKIEIEKHDLPISITTTVWVELKNSQKKISEYNEKTGKDNQKHDLIVRAVHSSDIKTWSKLTLASNLYTEQREFIKNGGSIHRIILGDFKSEKEILQIASSSESSDSTLLARRYKDVLDTMRKIGVTAHYMKFPSDVSNQNRFLYTKNKDSIWLYKDHFDFNSDFKMEWLTREGELAKCTISSNSNTEELSVIEASWNRLFNDDGCSTEFRNSIPENRQYNI